MGDIARLILCEDCLVLEILPDFVGPAGQEADDPLRGRIIAWHRGPLNRQHLKGRPNNAPNPRFIPDEKMTCDVCMGGGCSICQGTGEIYRFPHKKEQFPVVSDDDWNDSRA